MYVSVNLSYAEWEQADKMPTFDEFMDVGCVEIGIYLTLASCFFGMDQIDGEKAFEWLKSRPKLAQALAKKSRILNDITGFEVYRHALYYSFFWGVEIMILLHMWLG